MLINDCTHACVMTSVVLCFLGKPLSSVIWAGSVNQTGSASFMSYITFIVCCLLS